jgi:hypothetical protein
MPHHGRFETTAGERSYIAVPQGWKYDQSKRGLVVCHALNQDATNGLDGAGTLAESTGLVVCFADHTASPGAQAGWGNSSEVAKVVAQWGVLKSSYGVKTDKMLLSGISMGTATALLTLLNPDNVAGAGAANIAAVELELPAVSIDDIHTTNALSAAAGIDTAYGGNWAAAKAAHNPLDNAATFAALKVPILMHYGGADPVCQPQFARQFAAAVPSVEPINMGDAVGHSIAAFEDGYRSNWLKKYAV